jgi:hypothetical protein
MGVVIVFGRGWKSDELDDGATSMDGAILERAVAREAVNSYATVTEGDGDGGWVKVLVRGAWADTPLLCTLPGQFVSRGGATRALTPAFRLRTGQGGSANLDIASLYTDRRQAQRMERGSEGHEITLRKQWY